jgi:hypothetical protein
VGDDVDHADCFDPWFRGLAIEQSRGLTGLDGPPEGLFGGSQNSLVDRVGIDRKLNPLAAAVDDGELLVPLRAPRGRTV